MGSIKQIRRRESPWLLWGCLAAHRAVWELDMTWPWSFPENWWKREIKGIIRWTVIIPRTINMVRLWALLRGREGLWVFTPVPGCISWEGWSYLELCLLPRVYADGVPGVRGSDILFKVWKPQGSFVHVEAGHSRWGLISALTVSPVSHLYITSLLSLSSASF